MGESKLWRCEECGKIVAYSYDALAEVDNPVCLKCGGGVVWGADSSARDSVSEKYVEVSLTPEDVADMAEHYGFKLTRDTCVEFLDRNSKEIRAELVERGRDVITMLARRDGIITS